MVTVAASLRTWTKLFTTGGTIASLSIGTALIGGCSSKADQAKRRLEMIEKVGTLGEVCEASKAISNAYLDQGDQQNYEYYDALAGTRCLTARMQGYDLPADDKLRKMVSDNVEAEVDAAVANAAR